MIFQFFEYLEFYVYWLDEDDVGNFSYELEIVIELVKSLDINYVIKNQEEVYVKLILKYKFICVVVVYVDIK